MIYCNVDDLFFLFSKYIHVRYGVKLRKNAMVGKRLPKAFQTWSAYLLYLHTSSDTLQHNTQILIKPHCFSKNVLLKRVKHLCMLSSCSTTNTSKNVFMTTKMWIPFFMSTRSSITLCTLL